MSLSQEIESTSSTPAETSGVDDARVLLEFISQLGLSMSAAGEPVSTNRASLMKIAKAYGVDTEVSVLPNMLFVRLNESASSALDLASRADLSLRLDQTAEVFNLVQSAERAEIAPADGLRRITEIERQPPRYGAATRILGYAVITVGLGLILEGSFAQLLTCILLGVLIGELKELSEGNRTAQVLSPVMASLAVGMIVFSIVKADLVSGPLMLLIPPVVSFLPGAMLTTAMIELANGDSISGSSRLVAGTTKLLLLVFGFVVAAELIGLPTAEAFAQVPKPLFGWWAPWVGVIIYGIGNYVHHTAPKGSLPWLWLVLYVAFIGQQIGGQIVGGYLSGFVGAVAMAPVAFWIQRRPGAPPALVTFLPAFWLLVPGSLGLIGLTQLVAENRQAGLETVGDMIFAIVAVALGVMVGVALIQPMGKPIARLPLWAERTLGKGIGKAIIVVKNTSEAAHSELARANANTQADTEADQADEEPAAPNSAGGSE
jgi:uncharacterized membrane protein YjjP (DUF1212 family)